MDIKDRRPAGTFKRQRELGPVVSPRYFDSFDLYIGIYALILLDHVVYRVCAVVTPAPVLKGDRFAAVDQMVRVICDRLPHGWQAFVFFRISGAGRPVPASARCNTRKNANGCNNR